MKRSAYRKEIRRAITKSWSRFAAITAIVAMGAGFLAGLMACKPDMQLTADAYYDTTNMMDFRILSTMGLTDDDVQALEEVEGIAEAEPAHYTDQEVKIRDQEYLIRIHSIPETVNQLVLLDGRMPEPGKAECVINPGKKEADKVAIGDVIILPEDSDALVYKEYTIVGTVRSSLYLSFSFGSTTMGNGSLDYAAYVMPEDYTADYYTEIYLTTEGTDGLNAYTEEYTEIVDTVKSRIEDIREEREKARYQGIVEEAKAELNEGYAEYEDAKNEALEELEEAEKELNEAEEELSEAEKELNEAEKELNEGEKKLYDAEIQIAEGYTKYEEGVAELARQKEEAYEKFQEAEAQLTDAQKEANEGYALLVESYEQLSAAEAQLKASREKLDTAKTQLNSNQKALEKAASQLKAGKEELEQKEKQLQEAKESMALFKVQLQLEEEEIRQLKKEIAQKEEDGSDEELEILEQELADLESTHAENTARYDAYSEEYEKQKSTYTEASQAYEDGYASYQSFEAAYGEAVGELEAGRALLEAGAADLAEQESLYQQNLTLYESAVEQYQQGELQYQLGYIEKDADWQQVVSDLEDLEGIEGIMPLETKSAESRNGEKTADVQLYVVPDDEQVHSFVNLRERISRDPVILDPNSVLLTEKLSVKLSLKVGDTIQVKDAHGRFQELTVGGIVEHYVNDFVYITQDLYTSLLADEWKPNEMVVCLDGSEEEAAVMQEIRDTSNDITTIQNIDDLTVTMRAMMESLKSVIIVIILAAGLLAFIVLYNLTNINIMERKREIATIKVLGFYHGEVNSYIYRETTVLTIIGSLFGLALGVVLHRFVIQTVEVDRVMFSRTIETLSYVFSAMLTLAFSVIVNLIMYRKLKKISMVESLKSVD